MSIWSRDSSLTQVLPWEAANICQRFLMDCFYPFILLAKAQKGFHTCEEEPKDRMVGSLITPGVPWTLKCLSDPEWCSPVANNVLTPSPAFMWAVLSQALVGSSWLIHLWVLWYSQWLTVAFQTCVSMISKLVVAHGQQHARFILAHSYPGPSVMSSALEWPSLRTLPCTRRKH